MPPTLQNLCNKFCQTNTSAPSIKTSASPPPYFVFLLRFGNTFGGRGAGVKAFIFFCLLAWLCSSRPIHAQQSPAVSGNPSASSSASAVPPSQLKADLNRILGSREFQPDTPDNNYLRDKMAEGRRLWQRVRDWWDHLFQTGGLRGGSNLVIGVLLTFISAGLLWIVFRMFRDRSPREYAARPARKMAAEEEDWAEIERDAGVWLTQAEEWARQGDFRRAFRAVFLAMLLQLDNAELLSYDRARTNGDYLRQLQQARNQPIYALLVSYAAAFDARWYGDQPTSQQDYQDIRDAHKQLPELIKSTLPPAANGEAQEFRAPAANNGAGLP